MYSVLLSCLKPVTYLGLYLAGCGSLHRAGLFEVIIEKTINCFFTDVFGLNVCTMLTCEYKDNSR